MASPTTLTTTEFDLLTSCDPELDRKTISLRDLRIGCPLDNDHLRSPPIFDAKVPAPLSSLGALAILPTEIAFTILEDVNLQSLTLFRAVSQGSRALVDKLPAYDIIVKHCPDALRALLATETAVHFSCQDLLGALYQQECVQCRRYGSFLELFTLRRFCFICVIEGSDNLLTVPTIAAEDVFGLSLEEIEEMRTVYSLPEGICARVHLIRIPDKPATWRLSNWIPQTFDASQDNFSTQIHRLLTMVRFPSLDPRTRDLNWGVTCQACRLGTHSRSASFPNPANNNHRKHVHYSAAGYLEHFQTCKPSQLARSWISEQLDSGDDDGDLARRFLDFLDSLKL